MLELLEIVQFRSPDTTVKYSQALSNMKYGYIVSFKIPVKKADSIIYFLPFVYDIICFVG